MILSPDEIQGASNATGVFLQFPVETELEWLSRIGPVDSPGGNHLSLR